MEVNRDDCPTVSKRTASHIEGETEFSYMTVTTGRGGAAWISTGGIV